MPMSDESPVDADEILESIAGDVVAAAEESIVDDHDGSVYIVPAAVVRALHDDLELELTRARDGAFTTAKRAVLLSCLEDAIDDEWNGRQ